MRGSSFLISYQTLTLPWIDWVSAIDCTVRFPMKFRMKINKTHKFPWFFSLHDRWEFRTEKCVLDSCVIYYTFNHNFSGWVRGLGCNLMTLRNRDEIDEGFFHSIFVLSFLIFFCFCHFLDHRSLYAFLFDTIIIYYYISSKIVPVPIWSNPMHCTALRCIQNNKRKFKSIK